MQDKSARNRKRSQRRRIFCPKHGCYLDSVSQKHGLYADKPEALQARGVSRLASQQLLKANTTVSISGEWLEAFWCEECQESRWFYVRKLDSLAYEVCLAPDALWQSVSGVIDPLGNPSVGQFTREASRLIGYQGIRDFKAIG